MENRQPVREPIPNTLHDVIADADFWNEELSRCPGDSIRHAAIESRLERLAYRTSLLLENQPKMTPLLEKAFQEAAKLSPEEQITLARTVLNEIAAHHREVLIASARR